jgi:hypothetical protein
VNIYEDPGVVSHAVADQALSGQAAALDPNTVLVGLALHDDDRLYMERWCRRQRGGSPFRSTPIALRIGDEIRRRRRLMRVPVKQRRDHGHG